MNREELIEKVAEALADDWDPHRDPILTAMFRDYAATAADAMLSAVADNLEAALPVDDFIEVIDGWEMATNHLRSLITEGKSDD